MGSIGGGKLMLEGKSVGVTAEVAKMFLKAQQYGNFRNAPESFRNEFSQKAAQSLIDVEKKAEIKAKTIMEAKIEKAFSGGGSEMADAARKQYTETMEKVRNYIRKLNTIQNKFNS